MAAKQLLEFAFAARHFDPRDRDRLALCFEAVSFNVNYFRLTLAAKIRRTAVCRTTVAALRTTVAKTSVGHRSSDAQQCGDQRD